VINMLPWPVYRRGKGPRYPFIGKLGGSQNGPGICGKEKYFLSLAGIDPIFPVRLTLKYSQYKHHGSAKVYSIFGEKIVCTAVVTVCV
jgi:hypothetical protein